MGAWGVGNYSNDTALDFVGEISGGKDIENAMNDVLSGEIDADAACMALAAADIAASSIDRHAADTPDEVVEFVQSLSCDRDGLLALARKAVKAVEKNSELAELWEEAEDEYEEWSNVLKDLLKRLDPKAPYTPPAKDEAAQATGFICALCELPISDEALVAFEIDFPDMPGISMTTYAHRHCVEERFDGPHFETGNKPTSSVSAQMKAHLGMK